MAMRMTTAIKIERPMANEGSVVFPFGLGDSVVVEPSFLHPQISAPSDTE